MENMAQVTPGMSVEGELHPLFEAPHETHRCRITDYEQDEGSMVMLETSGTTTMTFFKATTRAMGVVLTINSKP